jgi:DNA-binding MarR family transcriptional regulator
MSEWTFITSHAAVLLAIAENLDVRVEQLARDLRLAERTVRKIIGELVEAGYLRRHRKGRRNVYALRASRRLRDPLLGNASVADLLELRR